MQPNKTQSKEKLGPVHRAIPQPPPAALPEVAPGEIGAAAITDAANHQLDRYAQDIEQYLQTSKLRTLLDKLQAQVNPDPPRLRLRRD
jgi:hypothetical protein